ncbi:tRNA (guanosine-2'-O-)-methyltransferase [Chitinophaga costaii]|uniref:tRNA (guanosine(18)-2'-O)-methyltransferase n=1 Tax=Chitinophaga costaii TaxID=1335309 RepID=A0A1C3Z8T8_9BACT|nr:TrmH family RNA methyltransferase [Chitinophaga costaii]PUZ30278.1 RNA methyltransferase [Chitinophaga costaii]SCB78791.1 tRNA (guanosine-2'-O-)-methyltransferase [Chitinophaga costaii]
MTPARRERLLTVLQRRQAGLTVVLENVEDPHNISAVMRTCDAVGIQDIHVLNTRIARHKNWGFKSSSSANKWLTVHNYDHLETCVAALRQRYDKILTTHLSSDAINMYDIDFKGRLALVFGSERDGVSDELRALADGNFVIPQMGIIRSLNISVACAVTLYEGLRQRTEAGLYQQQSLPQAQFDGLLGEWGFQEEDR